MSSRVLRIAFATPEYVTERYFDSGIAASVHQIATALARRGHDVHVVTKSEIHEATFRHEGVTVHPVTFGKTWLQLNRLTRYRLSTTMHLLGLSAQVYRKLKQLHAERTFDLLQFPNCSSCGLFSMLLLKVPHVMRASWYQPFWERANQQEHTLDSRAGELLERLQLCLSPHVYAPSSALQRILQHEQKLERVQVFRNPFFIDNSKWDESVYQRHLKDKKYILFFGRFELRKGFHVLAQALPAVLEKYPDCHCVLVGRDMSSALAPSMADYARSLCHGFSKRLIILGAVPHSQLYPIIAGARLVVLPSLIDNYPNACREAMALGKAVIGTLGASFEEMISDGINGFLVPANDKDALTNKIIEAWSLPHLDDIGRAAQLSLSHLAPDNAIEALLNYYEVVMHGSLRWESTK